MPMTWATMTFLFPLCWDCGRSLFREVTFILAWAVRRDEILRVVPGEHSQQLWDEK